MAPELERTLSDLAAAAPGVDAAADDGALTELRRAGHAPAHVLQRVATWLTAEHMKEGEELVELQAFCRDDDAHLHLIGDPDGWRRRLDPHGSRVDSRTAFMLEMVPVEPDAIDDPRVWAARTASWIHLLRGERDQAVAMLQAIVEAWWRRQIHSRFEVATTINDLIRLSLWYPTLENGDLSIDDLVGSWLEAGGHEDVLARPLAPEGRNEDILERALMLADDGFDEPSAAAALLRLGRHDEARARLDDVLMDLEGWRLDQVETLLTDLAAHGFAAQLHEALAEPPGSLAPTARAIAGLAHGQFGEPDDDTLEALGRILTRRETLRASGIL